MLHYYTISSVRPFSMGALKKLLILGMNFHFWKNYTKTRRGKKEKIVWADNAFIKKI